MDGMGLRETCLFEDATTRGLATISSEQPVKHRPWQAETHLKHVFSVDWRLLVHTHVFSKHGLRT